MEIFGEPMIIMRWFMKKLSKQAIFLIVLLYVAVSYSLTDDIKQNRVLFENSFRQFLQDVKKNSIKNKDWSEVDWKGYIKNQLQNLPISNEEEFYEVVKEALHDLKDNHSNIMKNSNDKYDLITNQPVNSYANLIYVEDGVGIIKLTTYMINVISQEDALSEYVVKQYHERLAKIKSAVSKGWIIDLKDNAGGNMYPMLACLSDFLSNKPIGGFYMYEHSKRPSKQIILFDGKNFLFNKQIALSYKNYYSIGTITLPTVVIISNKTASSGEFVALALARQPNVILIGQPSAGLATANIPIELPNKLGYYALTVGYYLDKDNKPLLTEQVSPAILFSDPNENLIEEAKKLILKR